MKYSLWVLPLLLCACFGRTPPPITEIEQKAEKVQITTEKETTVSTHSDTESDVSWVIAICVLGAGLGLALTVFVPAEKTVGIAVMVGCGGSLVIALVVASVLPYLKYVGWGVIGVGFVGGGYLIYRLVEHKKALTSVVAVSQAVATNAQASGALEPGVKMVVQSMANTVKAVAERVL